MLTGTTALKRHQGEGLYTPAVFNVTYHPTTRMATPQLTHSEGNNN